MFALSFFKIRRKIFKVADYLRYVFMPSHHLLMMAAALIGRTSLNHLANQDIDLD
jgi:hypothetical protein